MKKLIAGNWKMNCDVEAAIALGDDIAEALEKDTNLSDMVEFLICPPAVYLMIMKAMIDGAGCDLSLGAQDCSAQENGAHTGDVSSSMISDIGCSYVILGHSERRANHNESSKDVRDKATKIHENGLTAIICVGEIGSERENNQQNLVVETQLLESLPDTANAENTVIAYEPVWAIGTGKTATPEDVKAMHSFIRGKLKENLACGENMRILYGGSMKPDNAKLLLAVPNVDGGLIGGASLKVNDFLAIGRAAL